MGFNYGLEKKRFDEAWKKTEAEYRAAGMEEELILSMHEYDWSVFKSRRVYETHVQALPDGTFDDGGSIDEEHSPLLGRMLEKMSVSDDDVIFAVCGTWVDQIESEDLAWKLKKLDQTDIELLTMWVFEEKSMTEIAAIRGVSKMAISKAISRIRKELG